MSWQELADMVIGTSIATFGRCVVYYPLNHDPVQIKGIFDQAHVEVDVQAGVPVDSTFPVLNIRLADLPAAPSQGDKAEIGGCLYRVISNQPDGQGGSLLVLQKL